MHRRIIQIKHGRLQVPAPQFKQTGDKLRLADTDLVIEVERNLTTCGEGVSFGGGKVIRDGMGQSWATRAQGAVDTVIANALTVDRFRICKADIGLKNGLIAGIGLATQTNALSTALQVPVGEGFKT